MGWRTQSRAECSRARQPGRSGWPAVHRKAAHGGLVLVQLPLVFELRTVAPAVIHEVPVCHTRRNARK